MAVVQDTYNAAPGKGYPGMVANGETSNRISRTCEDAAGIAFGKAVYRGAGDEGCTGVPAANAFLGFAIADHGVQPLPGGVAADIYPQRASVGIMTGGAIYVLVGEDVTDGAPVYVTPAGAIVDTVGANIAATGWVFDETVANGGICRIARR
jgi:hypothetical protein